MQIVDGNTLYIADRGNHRVIVIQPNSTAAVTILGSGLGNGSNQFNEPMAVFVTNTSIYVLDARNYRVQMYSINGSNVTTVAGIRGVVGNSSTNNTFDYSYGICLDMYDYLYVSDTSNHRILRFPPGSTSGTDGIVVAGTGILGAGSSQLNLPYGIFVADDRSIYIADAGNNRIQRWAYGAGSGMTVAGTGVAGITDNQFDFPLSVIVDANQYLYVCDGSNNRIQRWAPGACSGQCLVGCSRNSGVGSDLLYYPRSVAFDNQGALYVSDGSQSRVQKFATRTAIVTGKNHDRKHVGCQILQLSCAIAFRAIELIIRLQVGTRRRDRGRLRIRSRRKRFIVVVVQFRHADCGQQYALHRRLLQSPSGRRPAWLDECNGHHRLVWHWAQSTVSTGERRRHQHVHLHSRRIQLSGTDVAKERIEWYHCRWNWSCWKFFKLNPHWTRSGHLLGQVWVLVCR